jgi:hypothetical protein
MRPYVTPSHRLASPAKRRTHGRRIPGRGVMTCGSRWGRRAWLVPAAAAVLAAAVVVGSEALSRALYGGPTPARSQQAAAAVRNEAAAWVAAQVSRSDVVSCDPVMCHALEKHGIPPGDLHELDPGTAGPLRSDVIVVTAAIRAEFGAGLNSVCAPGVIASFGSAGTRIDIRVIAPKGAAAYRSALRGPGGPEKGRSGVLAQPADLGVGHGPKATDSRPGRFLARVDHRQPGVHVAGLHRDLWRPGPRCQPRHPAPGRLSVWGFVS